MANQKKECVITVGSMMILLMMKMRRSAVKMITAYKYKTINTRTLDGIRKAEKLHRSKYWKQINSGLFTIMYERIKND